jgi:GH25 family lysozyme M1 (1,4-beta-N-acetylmuramidase)
MRTDGLIYLWLTDSFLRTGVLWRRYRSIFACILLSLFISIAANGGTRAADCTVERASKNIPYRAAGPGIVPTGFVLPSGDDAVVHGIDASKYQEATDFDMVRECGGAFAYIRLSTGADADTELAYRVLWANAKSADLMTGPYHDLTLIDSKSPVGSLKPTGVDKLLADNVEHAQAQARLFKTRLLELLDYDPLTEESGGSYGAPYLPAVLALTARPQARGTTRDQAQFGRIYVAAICEWIREFQSDPRFKEQPVVLLTKPFIYRDFQLESAPCNLSQSKIWISHYGRTGDSAINETDSISKSAIDELCRVSTGENRCIFEQYTPFGRFAMYKSGGGLDLDRYYGSIESLRGLLQRANRQF